MEFAHIYVIEADLRIGLLRNRITGNGGHQWKSCIDNGTGNVKKCCCKLTKNSSFVIFPTILAPYVWGKFHPSIL